MFRWIKRKIQSFKKPKLLPKGTKIRITEAESAYKDRIGIIGAVDHDCEVLPYRVEFYNKDYHWAGHDDVTLYSDIRKRKKNA